MSANTVARLKITLDAVKPTVLRRVEVPFDIRLDRLHLTMQAALGWTNSHLYEIRAGDVGWSTLYPEADWPEDFLDARNARLDKVIEDVGTKTLRYIYDFGDGWKHTIKIERLTDTEPGVMYPRLIAATGRCPPEDCGGPWGMPNSSMRSAIPLMSDTLNSRNGLDTTSILTMLIARSSRRTSQCWRSSGRGPRPHDALAARSHAGCRRPAI
jgi:hypothetical protein